MVQMLSRQNLAGDKSLTNSSAAWEWEVHVHNEQPAEGHQKPIAQEAYQKDDWKQLPQAGFP